MARLLLNSAMIAEGGDGTYIYRTVSREEAVGMLQRGGWESHLGYPATVDFLHRLTGIRFPLNRSSSVMLPGDVALVVRLKYRVADPATKKDTTPKDEDYIFGWMGRVA